MDFTAILRVLSCAKLLVQAECMCQHNEVAIILGIIFSLSLLSLSSFLHKIPEGVVLGLHGLLIHKNIKISTHIFLTGTPLPPRGGGVFRFYENLFENIRRKLVRVLKLHRVFMLPGDRF